ncbi:zinc finger protein [Macleaya cordata]|uniref:Zinc finger protein n=1 Tax=Macleaya cordata TaxID=56857 RepID=A0A200PUM0_MACCD|nr:zinc finger protein [Macleaya cordata]
MRMQYGDQIRVHNWEQELVSNAGSPNIRLLMVREKDVCWEYCEKLEGNKVRCKFCLKVLNGGISRLKHHLSRLPSKGVHPCSKVRDDVTDRVRAIIALKEEGKETASAKKQRIAETKPLANVVPTKPAALCVETTSPISKIFPSGTQFAPPSLSDRENAERSIALFFYENKLEFSVARSSSYQVMMEAVAKCGYGFRGPSSEDLKTAWLERIKSEVSQQSRESEKEWSLTGCTIIADTWTDEKSRTLINFLVSSPSGTFFHKSVDASTYFKNTKFLADLFDSVIQDIGPENVVQVIMGNALLNYVDVGNHRIMQKYSTIFCTPCASQCLDLILEDFSKIDWVNRCILQAQFITKFIYNRTWVLDLMKKFTGGQELVRTSFTRSTSDFLSLQFMLKQRSILKHMFNSPEYSTNPAYANKPQSISCIDILSDDNGFWRGVEESVAVSEPILKVLREVAGGKPAMGFIYESMTRAKESIRTYYIMDENKCKTFLDIVDRRWQNQLHSPLHAAAAFLNPSIQYNPEVKFLGIIKEDFLKVLEKLLPTPELRHDITAQILAFKKSQGVFGHVFAREARNKISPGHWWEEYGGSAPGLQRVAVRILSQVCSAFQQIHSEKRNKPDKETVADLTYVNYNLKLASRMKAKPIETDPILVDDIDMPSEWIEETENPSPTQWLDRYGAVLDGSDLNTRQYSNAIFGSGNDHLFNLDRC